MADETPAEKALDWKQIGQLFAAGAATGIDPGSLAKAYLSAHLEAQGGVAGLTWSTVLETALLAGEGLHKVEEPFLPVIAAFVAPILSGLFGADFDADEFARRMGKGAGTRGAQAILDGFMKAIVGDTAAEIVPSDAGAKRIAAAAVQAELESGFNAVAFEALSHMLPFDIGHFEGVKELPEGIIRSLGVSRLVRRALQPIVTTCCTTPATWHMNKLHRPTLLGAATLARLIARNPDQKEKWVEDLRRDGYSDDRIDALLNDQRKFFSPSDVRTFVTREHWSGEQGLAHLMDQGYDHDTATEALRLEGLRRIDELETQEANAIIAAYTSGDIDHSTFTSMLSGAVTPAPERALLTELAEVRRAANVKQLTLAQVETMVKSGVLSVIDYRRTAERLGYAPDATIALELQLRWELDQAHTIAEHRIALEKSRADEKAARAQAAADRKAAADARLALERRGTMNDLEDAYIRGLIPLARVVEVYDATYDDDTAGVLSDLLQVKRADYVARLDAAEKARQRAATRGVNVPELESAVIHGVLTMDQYRRRLAELGFTADDVELLTSTLAARIKARDDAERMRDDAAAAAKVRHVDLPTFELLVRRGHRTMADYAALLASLNFDQAAIAALRERLQIQIDDDAKAAAERLAAAAKLRNKGLSLDQFRRAVILGITPIAAFAPFLLDNGFSAAAVQVLVGELQTDRDEAVAAQQRRTDAARRLQAGSAPLSDVHRAARLGLIPVDRYYARLRADGYTDDDVAIESDLLTTEIADDAARKATAAEAEAKAAIKGLTLAQLAAAVKVGTAPIGDYHARAIAIGLSPADADTLTATLQAEVDARAARERRKAELAAAAPERELTRADVAKGVKQGLATIDDYAAWLDGAGYSPDDAALLVDELQTELAGKAAGDTGPAGG
jgi:hypothetical protein